MSLQKIEIKELKKATVGEKEIYAGVSFAGLAFFDTALKKHRTDYYNIVKEMLAKCETIPISKIKKHEIDSYISLCLDCDNKLNEIYCHNDSVDTYERFVKSSLEVMKDLSSNLSKTIANVIPKYNYSDIFPNISFIANLPKKAIISEELKNTIALNLSFVSTLAETIKMNQQSIIDIVNSNPFKGLQKRINEFYKNINIPGVSEHRKRILSKYYSKWGKYGWTVPPYADISIFNACPNNKSEADKKMDVLFRSDEIQKVFYELRKMNIKQSDLKEAISNYNDKRYKSCAMILFGIIDSKLIRLQQESDKDSRGYRPTGKSAAKNVMNRVNSKISDSMLISYLDEVNVAAALESIFETGHDFKKQPDVINRHFLLHGMLHRPVRKRDCIQLFLIIYNLMLYLNLLNDNTKQVSLS